MGTRAQLHQILKGLTDNVYYQTPEGFKMQYPCIRYSKNKRTPAFADNIPYKIDSGYSLTVITTDPDDTLPDEVALLPTANQTAKYQSKNLYHDVFDIYY